MSRQKQQENHSFTPLFRFVTIAELAVVTLLYFNHLDFQRPTPWIWYFLFITIAPYSVYNIWIHRNLPTGNPITVPATWRSYLLIQGTLLCLYAVAMIIAPTFFASFWPWKIDEFHARVYSAIFLTGGVGSLVLVSSAARRIRNIPTKFTITADVSWSRQVGPLKGYPLRVDFAHAPTYAERTLIVGEAAGLVNPVTGEGIDYALESGKMAAEYLLHLFATGDFSLKRLSTYDSLLRERYQRLYVICDRLRSFYLNPQPCH